MNYTNYGFPQYQAPQRPNYAPIQSGFRMFQVSNIMEANATPVEGFEPIFFYNKAENVIYMKQLNQLGAAPIQVFKLEPVQAPISEEKKEDNKNPYEDNFKAINDKLTALKNDLSIKIDKLIKEDTKEVEIEDKKGAKK